MKIKRTEAPRNEKTTADQPNNTTGRNKLKYMGEDGRLKSYRYRVKQYKQKKTFQHNERKFDR